MRLSQYLFMVAAGTGILIFLVTFIIGLVSRRPYSLNNLLSRAFVGSAIPTGIMLIICAFDTSLLAKLDGINIYIGAAGLSLLYNVYSTLSSGRRD